VPSWHALGCILPFSYLYPSKGKWDLHTAQTKTHLNRLKDNTIQFLRKMWPIQLAFRLLISCTTTTTTTTTTAAAAAKYARWKILTMKGTEWAAKPYGITNNYTTHQTTKIKYFLDNIKESRNSQSEIYAAFHWHKISKLWTCQKQGS